MARDAEGGGRSWQFYVEMGFVVLGALAVLAWLGALLYVIVF